jgi:hypothetical protein
VSLVGEQARLALDKRLQLAAARHSGLCVPETVEARGGDLGPNVEAFPVVAKPALAAEERDGRLTRGAGTMCMDRRQLDNALVAASGGSPWLVQPLLSGVGEGLFGMATAGRPAALSAHRRIRMMNPRAPAPAPASRPRSTLH